MPQCHFRPLQAGSPGTLTLVLLLSLALLGVAPAKEYLVDTWRFDDDLPRDGIMSIAQGADGYLWVSSRYGLARFDGVRFASFGPQLGAQFLGYHYANLTPGPSGAVWLGTPGGGLLQWRDQSLLSCLPPGNPIFGPVFAGLTNAQGKDLAMTPDGRVLGWSNGVPELVVVANRWGEPVPSTLCQDKQGRIWFVTYQHKLVRLQGTNLQEMVYGTGDNRRNWVALQIDGSGELWAGTQRDLGVWRGDEFQPIVTPTDPFPVDDLIAIPKAVRRGTSSSASASPAERSRLWAVALGRAWLLEGNHFLTNVLFEPSAGIYETSPRMADKDGSLWFTATKASLAQAGADGSLMLLSGKDGLPPGRVAALFQDREQSIWAGIEHAGLARLRERFFTALGTRDGLRAPLVWAVLEDSTGAIWLGTENSGLHRWQEGKFTQFNLGNGGLPGSVYSLCLDRQGALWAGTGDKGVFRFENGKFVPVWEYPGPGWNKRIYAIYEDRHGQIWFGTGLGLFRWRNGNAHACAGKGFDLGVVHAISEDATGRLWVGMSGGSGPRLAWLEGEQLVPRGMGEGLSGQDIFSLHPGADGSMWIGTAWGGLWRWHNDQWSQYTTAEGLPDDRIYSIDEDSAGNLWLGSPVGILRVTSRSLAAFGDEQAGSLDALVFNRTDGLPTRECSGGSQPAISHGRDGRLLFAMTEGAVALAPDKVQVNALPPPVLIEEVRVDGKQLELPPPEPVPGPAPPKAATLLIGPGRHVVEFHYTATSLVAPSKVRFKCRLEGVDKDWREVNASRSTMYSLTAPGNYRFRVTACNNDAVWNEAGTAVALRVLPHFWQTLWFRLAAFSATLLTVGGAIRFLERRKLQRKLEHLEMQQTVEKERARIARDIHDELGASLTEIGLLSDFAQRDSTPAEQVKADVQRIAAKAQSSTRALDEIVWAVNPRHDTLESFVTYACAYAEEQLRLAGIRCRLDVASSLPRRPLRADVRHHLFLAFKEALNNVVKHARASQVDIRIGAELDHLILSLTDNGSGFAGNLGQEEGAPGNGLVNMKERLESLGGAFACQSTPGQGTQVTLTINLE